MASSAAAAAAQDAKLWVAGLQLYQAAYQKSLPHMAEALAQGAEVNWRNQEKNSFTPLIQAVRGVSFACPALPTGPLGSQIQGHRIRAASCKFGEGKGEARFRPRA